MSVKLTAVETTVLLVAGDNAGHWADWYRRAVPLAEGRYALYLKEKETRQ